MDVGAILEGILERPRVAYVRAVLDAYGHAPGGLLANGLAFAALFTAVPIALLALGLAGWLVDDPAVQVAVADALVDVFPPLRDLIEDSLDSLIAGAGVASLIGLVATIWTVSQLYVTLDVAIARIFEDEPERDVVMRTARGFLWVGLLLAAVIALIILATLSATLGTLVPSIPGSGTIGSWLSSFPVLCVGAIVVVLVVYRTVPPHAPSWRAAALPAVIVGIVGVLLSQLFVFLAPRLVGVAAIAGSLATAFIALAWLSFTFQALLYGAAWVRVRDERARGAASAGPGSADLGGPAAPAEPGTRGE